MAAVISGVNPSYVRGLVESLDAAVDEAPSLPTIALTAWDFRKIQNKLGKGKWGRFAQGKMAVGFRYEPENVVDGDPIGKRFRMWVNGQGHREIGTVCAAPPGRGLAIVLVDLDKSDFVRQEMNRAAKGAAGNAGPNLPAIDEGQGGQLYEVTKLPCDSCQTTGLTLAHAEDCPTPEWDLSKSPAGECVSHCKQVEAKCRWCVEGYVEVRRPIEAKPMEPGVIS